MKMLRNLLLCALLCTLATPVWAAERLRDIADFAGVRDNQLVGYGLVVGLDGTGDQTMQSPFTGQGIVNMLNQLGVAIPPGTNMQPRNVAAVMVTADLPPFAGQGQRLDINVASIGNARSLRGGTLLMTPLKGADGETYAIAQGNMMISGGQAEAPGAQVQVNHQAAGRIAQGAIVEREVPTMLGQQNGQLELQLHEADFTTAERVVDVINSSFGELVAQATNSRSIVLNAPEDSNERVRFMAQVENLSVESADPRARVVLNSRTGSVVLNGEVRLRQAAVAHGNLTVSIRTRPVISQPQPFGAGETVVAPVSEIDMEQQEGALAMVEGADLLEVVDALNALGATPADLMAILEALKASGSLRAELEII